MVGATDLVGDRTSGERHGERRSWRSGDAPSTLSYLTGLSRTAKFLVVSCISCIVTACRSLPVARIGVLGSNEVLLIVFLVV